MKEKVGGRGEESSFCITGGGEVCVQWLLCKMEENALSRTKKCDGARMKYVQNCWGRGGGGVLKH